MTVNGVLLTVTACLRRALLRSRVTSFPTTFNSSLDAMNGATQEQGTRKEQRTMIRILIADDHYLVRSGIRSILEEKAGWEVCAEASDGYEAVALTRQLKPDIVV